MCLLRGTDWVFKESSLRFGFKGLMQNSIAGETFSWLVNVIKYLM
jgi:hypothetical protein